MHQSAGEGTLDCIPGVGVTCMSSTTLFFPLPRSWTAATSWCARTAAGSRATGILRRGGPAASSGTAASAGTTGGGSGRGPPWRRPPTCSATRCTPLNATPPHARHADASTPPPNHASFWPGGGSLRRRQTCLTNSREACVHEVSNALQAQSSFQSLGAFLSLTTVSGALQCGQYGHRARDCPNRGQGGGRGFQRREEGSRYPPRSGRQVRPG